MPWPVIKAVETYYKGAGTIDHHNRIHADELNIDKNMKIKKLTNPVNLCIFGIIVVNPYFSLQASGRVQANIKQQIFGRLADELIENKVRVYVILKW